MRPVIKGIEITEVADLNPERYAPDDPGDFICTLGLRIGPEQDAGAELFYLTVCSPRALARVAWTAGRSIATRTRMASG